MFLINILMLIGMNSIYNKMPDTSAKRRRQRLATSFARR